MKQNLIMSNISKLSKINAKGLKPYKMLQISKTPKVSKITCKEVTNAIEFKTSETDKLRNRSTETSDDYISISPPINWNGNKITITITRKII